MLQELLATGLLAGQAHLVGLGPRRKGGILPREVCACLVGGMKRVRSERSSCRFSFSCSPSLAWSLSLSLPPSVHLSVSVSLVCLSVCLSLSHSLVLHFKACGEVALSCGMLRGSLAGHLSQPWPALPCLATTASPLQQAHRSSESYAAPSAQSLWPLPPSPQPLGLSC